jgi:hypothetical protein
MKPLVYIETTIPSFYHDVRQEPEMVARRNWTREWWKSYRGLFRLRISEAVLAELAEGDYESQDDALGLLKGVVLLEIPDKAADIIDAYLANHLMPRDRLGDALHVAIASLHRCDFLLTWNCRHIANANKFEHLRILNTRLGLFVPTLATPMELCKEGSS